MSYIIIVFLSFLQSVIGFTLMSSSTMNFKEPAKKRIIIGFSTMISGICFLSYTLFTRGAHSVDSYAILIILLIELSWYLICSKDRFFVSLFSFLTFANIYISISYISDNLAIHVEGTAFVLERIIIRTIVYLIIIPLLFKYVRKYFHRLVEILHKEWRVAVLVPFVFLLIQIMVLYYPEPYWYWENNNWSKVIIVTVYMLFLSVYYLLYVQINSIVKKYALEKRELLMTQQEKLWEAELIRQKEAAKIASLKRHDMHHHNAVIMGLVKSGNLADLKKYMLSFDNDLCDYNENIFCSNPITNSIINIYFVRAKENDIKPVFNVSIPEKIAIDNIDLTCILGNALENAFEGCLRLPKDEEKEISITVKYLDSRLRIQVENTCRADIEFKNELPITQKENGGIGTKSIIYTAERYDGTAGFSVIKGKFITQIVLNAKK